MKNYRLYDAIDFVLDEDFIRWVSQRSPEDELFWEGWLGQNPDRHLVVAEARRILETVRIDSAIPGNLDTRKEVQRLMDTVQGKKQGRHRRLPPFRMWSIAAGITALLGTALVITIILAGRREKERFSYTHQIQAKQLIEQVNTSGKALRIVLPDSSVVELAPSSRLSYPHDMQNQQNRDVYLLGEAFFQVTKNPARPFRVFANEIVTKVLGTSFTVRAFDTDREIKVTVRTGKVRVYSQATEVNGSKASTIYKADMLLTPNQEAVYKRDEQELSKAIVEKPVIIDPAISRRSMIYEEAPVVQVLEQMKKAYGISIAYDEETLRQCTITADLTNDSLDTQLDLLCKAIDATYEIIDSEVFIRSKGCL